MLGLGGFPKVREDPQDTRLPQSAQVVPLRPIANELRNIADDLDGSEDEDRGPRPPFMRGDFDENLAERIGDFDLNKIAAELDRGVEADILSRRDWEAMVERAIRYLGLIYEEASGEMSAEGSISKAWHTLMLEASISFWANAHAEFLPSDGPVKIKDEKPIGSGHNGGPPLDDPNAPPPPPRSELADNFERVYNRYLTVGDKQYYRDFSRMLWSLGPKGTEFRKIYFNPLRQMPVSEWVKSENLIVSNDAADLSTAGRITEKIMMSHADVKRMEWKGVWLTESMGQPISEPTRIDETIGRTQGIDPRINIQQDIPYTIYETCCELDLPGFEHEEDGRQTGLPLPYIVTWDKRTRKIKRIVRNWKEEDEDFQARQRYVMFGLLPGFGLYFLGFVHLLGNTERALTAMEREVIDNTMMAIFPGWFAAKGAFSRGETNVRVGIAGVKEVDLGINKSINDVVKPIEVAPIGQAHMALFEKIEDNGRKIAQTLEIPVGEGQADIPVGTMIALIEQKTKVMAAVHKGIHAARAEELMLLRDLIAENPWVLTKVDPDGADWEEMVEEFEDFGLVPSSDPNTPSHIHRVMKGVGLAQIAQMFPDLANRMAIYKELLAVLQVPDPNSFVNPNPNQQPDPKVIQTQQKQAVAQLNVDAKMQTEKLRSDTMLQQSQGKIEEAKIDASSEAMKTHAQLVGDQMRQHDSAQEQAIDAQRERTHDMSMQERDHAHERGESERTRQHEMQWPQQPVKRSF